MTDTNEKLYTVKEVAEQGLIGYSSVPMIKKMIKEKKLRAYEINAESAKNYKIYRIPASAIEEFKTKTQTIPSTQ